MRTLLSRAAILACLALTSSLALAKRTPGKRTKMPTWKEISQVAVETLFEDVPEQLIKDLRYSQ